MKNGEKKLKKTVQGVKKHLDKDVKEYKTMIKEDTQLKKKLKK